MNEGELRMVLTGVFKRHQFMYDVNCTSTYVRLCDVHDVYRLAGKGQDVVLNLYLITVQLRGRETTEKL